MNNSPERPFSANLRAALNALVVCLSGFVIVRELAHPHGASLVAVILALAFLLTYVVGGAWLPKVRRRQRASVAIWLILLTAQTLALAWLIPYAAYLIFPLYFLYLHLIPKWRGVAMVGVCTGLTIATLAIAGQLSTGGVVGPLVGAFVAIAIGLGYRALFTENRKRQELIEALVATRQELAEKEREAGMLAERSRLAREIHDTVAQGLSSIQLLLHAVERIDPHHPAIDHVRLARQTAAENLDETRRFIHELTPAALETQTLPHALDRLTHAIGDGPPRFEAGGAVRDRDLHVAFQVSGEPVPLPMTVKTALLRIAQGALANVVQHAGASRAAMTLTYMENSVSLDIVDDGKGFDPEGIVSHADDGERQSFGLVAMRERVDQLGGSIIIESTIKSGTAVAVTFGFES